MVAPRQEGLIKLNFENREQYLSTLRKAFTKVGDLRFPLELIAQDWYKSERAIFKLQGPGGYPDFANPASERAKVKAVGFDYPLLKRNGKLEASVTSDTAEGSVKIISRRQLIIGTAIPYGIYHNSDKPRRKIPQRKFVFIGPESRFFNEKDKAKEGGRLTRWTGILEGYVDSVMKSRGFK